MSKLCISGGAIGADLAWGDEAREHGYAVKHLSFPGHKTQALEQELLRLTDKQLRLGNSDLARTAPVLDKKWPPQDAYVRKLLQRDWWQIRDTQAVYAISTINRDVVQGGTGWAVHTYINRNFVGRRLRLYVFDQIDGRWFQFGPKDTNSHWAAIEMPPVPPERFTGIGTRFINDVGREAVKSVFSGELT